MAKVELTIHKDKAQHFINTLNEVLEEEHISDKAESEIANLLYHCFGLGKPTKTMVSAESIIRRLEQFRYSKDPVQLMINEMKSII